jgi:hypothetical protein
MSIKNIFNDQQETSASSTPSANQLPVRACRYIIGCLTDREQDAFALVSKRMAIITLCDPSADLEDMEKRKKAIDSSKYAPSKLRELTIGPTGRFLFHHPDSTTPAVQNIHGKIQDKMKNDPNVDQTVRTVCAIESSHPGYIPLYHGGRIEAVVSMFFIRALLSTPYIPGIEPFPCLNPLIKFPSSYGPKTAGEALSEFPPDFDDHMEGVRKEFLSCNASLFAYFGLYGESTWDFYLTNRNVFRPDVKTFLEKLCENYQIRPNQKYFKQLEALHKELCQLAVTFGQQNLSRGQRYTMCEGALLHILVKPAILDKIGYASVAFGEIQKSDKPLSERCLTLREDPDSQPLMQVRLLAQSIFINSYGIKVFVHCCGGFFNEEGIPNNKPDSMEQREWGIQQKCLLRKSKIFKEAREIFTKMILLSPKKERPPADMQSSASTPKTILFNQRLLQQKASMVLPPGFTLQPHYNEKNLLVKVVQTDSDGQETIYLLTPPKTTSVPQKLFDEIARCKSLTGYYLVYDDLNKPVEIFESTRNRNGQDTIYTCSTTSKQYSL